MTDSLQKYFAEVFGTFTLVFVGSVPSWPAATAGS
jgi:glycerol uptake facilitator-like aquaporin